jgi:hypothetical protein
MVELGRFEKAERRHAGGEKTERADCVYDFRVATGNRETDDGRADIIDRREIGAAQSNVAEA